ncbi:MAG TPA: (2Fe-2S)-binding protein [Acidimicrobiales bacterium]|nr:(2Fe-2S)-binding protein [Acidimicrobiales bacterium]
MRAVAVGFVVNGEPVQVEVEPRRTLLDTLREELGLTGAHAGCEQGACGACSVLVGDDVVRSCLVLAVSAAGRSITTIEGIGTPEALHPLQEELRAHHGLQCGFCTPGIVLAALDLLARVERPDEGQVREALAGNLCRCTGYSGLVAAVVAAGRRGVGDASPGAPYAVP